MIRIAITVNGLKKKRVKRLKKRRNESCLFVKEICSDPIRQPGRYDKADCGWQPECKRIDAKNQMREPDRPHCHRRFMEPNVVFTPTFVIIRKPRLIVKREFEWVFRQIPGNDGVEPLIPIGNPAVSDIPEH